MSGSVYNLELELAGEHCKEEVIASDLRQQIVEYRQSLALMDDSSLLLEIERGEDSYFYTPNENGEADAGGSVGSNASKLEDTFDSGRLSSVYGRKTMVLPTNNPLSAKFG